MKTMPAFPNTLAPLARLEAARESYLSHTSLSNFDRVLTEATAISSATLHPNGTSGTATYTLAFPPGYANAIDTVHGGAISVLCDNLITCTIAVVTRRGFWEQGGVTRALEVRYLKALREGERAEAVCEVVGAGERSAVLRGVVRKESGEVAVVFGGELSAVRVVRGRL